MAELVAPCAFWVLVVSLATGSLSVPERVVLLVRCMGLYD